MGPGISLGADEMKHSLRRKLTISFLLISMISFIVIGIFVNVILERQFKNYIIDNLNQKKDNIVSLLENQYIKAGARWDIPAIENLGVGALTDGLIVRVADISAVVLWDAMTHNRGVCAEMLQSMAENMNKQYGSFQGGYTENAFQITANGKTVGTVAIGYYGPYFYSDNDLTFLNTLNKLLLMATAITGVVSVIIGTYTAKRLSGPISRVIKKAEQISEGDYTGRINEASSTREIIELTEAINTLADKLGKHEALRKRLTGDVAHELRTPIANLQSHLEAMIDGIWKPDAERLKGCHEETVRLTKIVKDLESLARYENENMQLDKERFNIADGLMKSLNSFQNEFKNKNIELKTDISDQFVKADKDKMTQVFVNIISNALKYTPEGGLIEVIATGDKDEITISVIDNGVGISEEDLPFIFERFYRADRSRCRGTGGSGIGLTIVKSLIEAHGGSVKVKSEYGKGSEVIIVLPR